MTQKGYLKYKRLMDIGLAVFLLLPFLAVGFAVALISLWVFRGKIFFFQPRLGYRNKVFRICKFTSLLPEQFEGRVLSPEERQTAWGEFLRNYSLDELPQLINILRGEMSFIGPRPLLPEYESLYSPAEARRHWVKPGMTGLAQVNGRNALSWDEKMQFDQQYVANFGVCQDAEILLKTCAVLLRGQCMSQGTGPKAVAAEQPAHDHLNPELKWGRS